MNEIVEIVYTDRFIDDVARIGSERILDELDRRLADLEDAALVGLDSLRPCLRERYGNDLRTFPCPPLAIVYRLIPSHGRLEFLSLIRKQDAI